MFFKKLFKKVEKEVFVAKVSKAIRECPTQEITDAWVKMFIVGLTQYQEVLNAVYKAVKDNSEPLARILWNLNEISKDKSIKDMLKQQKEQFKEKGTEIMNGVTKTVDAYKDILAEEGLTKTKKVKTPQPGSICDECGTDNVHASVSCNDEKCAEYTYVCTKCGHQYTVRHVID
jgi:hypothetical protein